MNRPNSMLEAADTHANPDLDWPAVPKQRPSFRWSDIWKAPVHDFPVRDEILYQYLPLSPDMDVLEVGPGSGFTAYRLSRRVRSLTLLDIARGTIERIRNSLRGLPNLSFVCADVCAPDLSNRMGRCFDAAYGLEVFEYVSDPQQALKNLGSVLRPKGVLLLNWPNYRPDQTKGVTYIQTRAELDDLVSQAGFASWEVYALRLRPYAQMLFRELHERPLSLCRRWRGYPDPRSAQCFDQTWTHQNGGKIDPYRHFLHGAWTVLFAAIRLGGDCFERTPIAAEGLNGNLLLLARR